jgi:hypothetical protein
MPVPNSAYRSPTCHSKPPCRNYVLRPGGRVLTVQDLPPVHGARWVTSRKADLVAAVRGGLISLEAACTRYRLSVEEFQAWQRMIDRSGMSGLRATYVLESRDRPHL